MRVLDNGRQMCYTGDMDQPNPTNPISDAFWRIASAATRMAQQFDTGEFVPNECDDDPEAYRLVSMIAETLVSAQ